MRKKVAKWLTGVLFSGIAILSYLALFYTPVFSNLIFSYVNNSVLKHAELQMDGKLVGNIIGNALGVSDLTIWNTSHSDTLISAGKILLNGWSVDLDQSHLEIDQLEAYGAFVNTDLLNSPADASSVNSSISLNIKNLFLDQGVILVRDADSSRLVNLDQVNGKLWYIDGYMGSEFSLRAESSHIPGFESAWISGLVARNPQGRLQYEDLSIYDDETYLTLNGSFHESTLNTRFQADEVPIDELSDVLELPESLQDALIDLDLQVILELGSTNVQLTGKGSFKLQERKYPFTVNSLSNDGSGLHADVTIGPEFNNFQLVLSREVGGMLEGHADLFRPDLNPFINSGDFRIMDPIGVVRFSGDGNSYAIDTKIESFFMNDIPFKSLQGQVDIDQSGKMVIKSVTISQEENHIGLEGTVSTDSMNIDGRLYVSSFNFLNQVNPREVVSGTLLSDFVLRGQPDSPQIIGELVPSDLGIGKILRINGIAKYDLHLVAGKLEGDIALQGRDGILMGDSLQAYDLLTNFSDAKFEIEELHAQGVNNLVSFSGLIDTNSVAIHKFNVRLDDDQLKLTDSVNIDRLADSRYQIPPFLLTFNLAGISAEGSYHPEQGLDIQSQYELLNLGDFMGFANLDIPFSGIATGSSHITGSLTDPQFHMNFTLLNGNTIGYPTDTAWVDLTLRSDATISHRIDASKEGGELTLIGQLPWGYGVAGDAVRDATQNFSIQFDNYRLRDVKLTTVVGQPISGRATGNVSYRGTPLNTKMDAALELRDARFDTLEFNTVYADFRYEDNLWTFDSLSTLSNWGYGHGVGTMPISLDLIADDRSSVYDRDIDMDFHFELNRMPFLTSYIGAMDIIEGDISADLSFRGPIRAPIRNGKVRAHNGTIQVSIMGNPITNVHSELTLVDNTMTIDHFSGRMLFTEGSALNIQGVVGRATSLIGDLIGIDAATSYTGKVNISGEVDFSSFFQPDFDIEIQGEEVYFRSADGLIEAIADANMTFTGQDTLDVNGVIPVKRAVYYDNFTAGDAYHEGIGGVDSSLFRYSLQTQYASDLLISNDQLEAEFEGELWLLDYGDGNMHFSGTLNAKEGGKFYYLGNELNIVEGEIAFHSVDFNPTISIEAEIEIEQELIKLTLTGDLLEPELIIDPGTSLLSQSDILTYLTINQTLVEVSFEDGSALNPVETYSEMLVEKQISKIGRELTGLDILSISGVDISGSRIGFGSDTTDVPRFQVGQRLSKNLKVTYEGELQPTGGKTDYDFGLEYQINRNVSVTSKVNQDGEVELNGRLKFTY